MNGTPFEGKAVGFVIMDGWRLHLLLADDDPAIGALLSRVVSGGRRRDVAGDHCAALAALAAVPPGRAVLVALERWPDARDAKVRTLTAQECRTLQLSADGRSIAEVAAELYISPTTVKTHLRHCAEKLGVRGRAAAVAEALRRGLIV